MRTTCTALVVLVLLAAVSAQQVITDFGEYQRKKAEYEAQKAKYDEFQSLKNVPLLASYDLIPKVKDAQAPAGNAEQLLPTYTGIPVNFNEATGPGRGVEAGNTPQNYFHTGPIPAKKSAPEPPPKPVVIPTGPGQDFVVPQSDDAAVAAPAAPSFSSGADAVASTASFAAPSAPAPAPTPTPAAFAPASSGQALFFGRGALPVTTATSFAPAPAAAPIQASPIPNLASAGAFAGTSAVPLRPLGKQFQLGPYLPHSDFHPGPIRAVPVLPEHLREDIIPHAPVPLFARETFFSHDFPAAASFGGQPARTYGPPGI